MVLTRKAVHCAVLLAVVMLSLAILYAHAGRAVPGLRAGHRLHRRGADAVPVRPDDRRRHVGRLARGDDQGAAAVGRRWPASACSCCCILVIGHAAIGPAGAASAQLRQRSQRQRPGRADLHQVRVPLRGHQRPADHRRARRDGAGAPGAHQPEADPADLSQPPGRQRPAGAAARARHLRPAQRGGHARAAARRHAVASCRSAPVAGQAADGATRPQRRPRRRGGRGRGRRRRAASEAGGAGGQPGALHRARGDPVRHRRASACWSAATRSSCSCAWSSC